MTCRLKAGGRGRGWRRVFFVVVAIAWAGGLSRPLQAQGGAADGLPPVARAAPGSWLGLPASSTGRLTFDTRPTTGPTPLRVRVPCEVTRSAPRACANVPRVGRPRYAPPSPAFERIVGLVVMGVLGVVLLSRGHG
jgi:hypothetical protein